MKNRKDILLRAAYDILKKCDESCFVISPMEICVFYDDADCDGSCLMEDIAENLNIKEGTMPLEPTTKKTEEPQ